MLEIILATRNRDKIKEIKKILQGVRVKIFTLDKYPHVPEIEEDGITIRDNAIKKAKTIATFTGKMALADDSGLEVKTLHGAPGIYSSRFAGPGCSYSDNNKKLLRLLKNVPLKKRQAQFKCVMALVNPSGRVKTTEGICKGYIGFEIKGKHGFGYDPVFVVPKYGKTFAELGLRIKNKISHRAIALQRMKKIIQQLIVNPHSFNS